MLNRSRATAAALILVAAGLTACAKDPMSPLETAADDRKEPTLPWYNVQTAPEPTLPWYSVNTTKEPTLPWYNVQKTALEPTLPWY